MSKLAFHRTSGEGFAKGTTDGIELTADRTAITLGGDHDAVGTWTSPWINPGMPVAEIIPSWNAEAPTASLVEVELQGATADGIETGWYVLGRWAFDDTSFKRTSVADQADAFGCVGVDTFRAAVPLAAYRVRLRLHAAWAGAPVVRMVTAIASDVATGAAMATSEPALAAGVELPVPAYSQTVHVGEYPEYDGGGASWCSATSTAMIVAYWGRGPAAADYAWVDPSFADPWVDHAARYTFDYGYGGSGNWSFNTAYAAQFGLDAFVTRLRSLREVELFIEAGIPIVTSIAAGPGEVKGFPLPQGTAGHLVVIVGFTAEGDPIVNDPAGATNQEVRRIYARSELETAWLAGSGGTSYVISTPGTTLPTSAGAW